MSATQKQKTTGMVEPHIKRPMNAFMAWSKEERRQMVAEGNNSNNSVMSRILGERWKCLDENERTIWKHEAERLKREHAAKYPDYKYKPRRRNSSAASTLSRLSPPISLTSSGNSRSPPEEERPDTPESLGSPEPLSTFNPDAELDVKKDLGQTDQIVRDNENIIMDQMQVSNPKVCLPKLPQSMLAAKRTNGVPNPERVACLRIVDVHGSHVCELWTCTGSHQLSKIMVFGGWDTCVPTPPNPLFR